MRLCGLHRRLSETAEVRRGGRDEPPLDTLVSEVGSDFILIELGFSKHGPQCCIGTMKGGRIIRPNFGGCTSSGAEAIQGRKKRCRGQVSHDLDVDGLCTEADKNSEVPLGASDSASIGSLQKKKSSVVYACACEGSTRSDPKRREVGHPLVGGCRARAR